MQDKLKRLANIKDGSYRLTKVASHFLLWKKTVDAGWITVETMKNGEKQFMFTSQQDSHNPVDFGIDNWTRAWLLKLRSDYCVYKEFAHSTLVDAEENKDAAIDLIISKLPQLEQNHAKQD